MTLTTTYLQETFAGTFELALLTEMAQAGLYKRVPTGAYLIRPGEYIRSVPIIIGGLPTFVRFVQSK